MTGDDSIDEAAAWLARLNARVVSTADLEAFYAWRQAPANAAAFAKAQAAWETAGTLERDPEIARAVADALARPAEVQRWRRRGVLAALAAAAVGGVYFTLPERIRTAVGEQRIVRLDDGSRVHVNTASSVRIAFDGDTRRVILEDGEAFFEVAPDPARAFVVAAGDADVRALGTRFLVRREGGVHVALAEGRVSVSAGGATRMLEPGEAVRVTKGKIGDPAPADIAALTGWLSGRLVFEETPLITAIAEVNRYSRDPVVLAAEGYGARAVNGVFETGDRAAFVSAVGALFALRAETLPNGTIRLSE
ncbi:FecR family protein [Sphingosinicella microcystinivorans]|uniref:FecR family protein n=1 Tax=Sphingosinicella microcystinivorans TaxID=335406 RepID=A0AAD1D2V1_SPHMI|nr:FecR domain-containing protein [Sphingosinicella microcystinivorans]RKS88648.1 FecR family protein [Sphingosinicella microcystinivorans]BBE32394.1 transcriptional regulator [Sphingosinicella microcystinivorans]